MIPWVQLGAATAPGGARMTLMRRGGEVSILVDGAELMNSRRGGSEVALGQIACAHIRDAAAPRVLIGGLGLGFTLRAVLAALGPGAEVTVAELVPEVVAWAQGELADVFAGALGDPRVRLLATDVAAPIAQAHAAYDAILLDVDNGPDGLVRPQNGALYDEGGLRAARRALRPGGVLAVWSASPAPAFTRRLAGAGFAVHEHLARSGPNKRGARHTIWTATTPSSA